MTEPLDGLQILTQYIEGFTQLAIHTKSAAEIKIMDANCNFYDIYMANAIKFRESMTHT